MYLFTIIRHRVYELNPLIALIAEIFVYWHLNNPQIISTIFLDWHIAPVNQLDRPLHLHIRIDSF